MIRPQMVVRSHLQILQRCFSNTNLQTFSMPYDGNIASYCAIPWASMTINNSAFLYRVSINIMVYRPTNNLFDSWVFMCPNLEYIEMAICRPLGSKIKPHNMQVCWDPEVPNEKPPSKVREVRLIADTDVLWESRGLILGLSHFPLLRKLALAYFQLKAHSWQIFFHDLRNTDFWEVHLDTLWLLNPTTNEDDTLLHFVRFRDEPSAQGAAKDIKIIHLPWPWGGEEEVVQGAGRGFAYERFEAFEEIEGYGEGAETGRST
ncbi:hypothetical protein CC86DRAFT_110302 [Ophiobolus disseminans]|uniref:F-box domain-containing protein n=1 Tax=Ophiobolus disseminans TaxID=1469910 RepID=A0A6A6ZJX4_9PLEO|nr:hypothetical protein CC86DRAFT_110302 [Ophiobolus disseminans]